MQHMIIVAHAMRHCHRHIAFARIVVKSWIGEEMTEKNIMHLAAMVFISILFYLGLKYKSGWTIAAAMIVLLFGDF